MVLCIDIGGTYTKHAFVSGDKVTQKGKWETVFSFLALCEKIEALLTPDTTSIAISSGGFWSEQGACLGSETIPETRTNSLTRYFQNKYGIAAAIQNDARCALLCEKKYGSLKGCRNAVVVVLGSSVGCAVLLDGKLYQGSHQKAGMLFKMPEAIAPYRYEYDTNTVKQAARYQRAFPMSVCTMKEIEQQALLGERMAQDIVLGYCMGVAEKMLFAQLLFDPEKIVLGGGIVNSQFLFSEITARYRELAHSIGEDGCPVIEKTQYGEDSNLIGAALIGGCL